MAIVIPVDLTVVTLSGQPQRFTLKEAANLLQLASALWQNRAGITFSRGECKTETVEMPGGSRTDAVDESAYHFLASKFRAGTGCRALFVDKTARDDLGGSSRADTRVCFVKYQSDSQSASRMLAHELGHLLGLPHINDPSKTGPGYESVQASWTRNLMNAGALNPDAEINDDQKKAAQTSDLAKKFGGG